jgi:hypothetical protein
VLVIACKGLTSGKFTAFGVLLGSTLALAAAGGQLGAVYEAARHLKLGGVEDHLSVYLFLSLGLLGVYGFFSVLGVLIQGYAETPEEDPVKEPVSETVFAAAVVAAYVSKQDGRQVNRETVDHILKDLQPSSTEDDAGVRAVDAPVRHRAVKPAARPATGRAALP